MSEDRCVICGDIVPEGRMICPNCEAGKMSRLQQLIDRRFCTPLIFEPSLTKDTCPMCKRPFNKDFVKVVRCKDCKYSTVLYANRISDGADMPFLVCNRHPAMSVGNMSYCDSGEPKEEIDE